MNKSTIGTLFLLAGGVVGAASAVGVTRSVHDNGSDRSESYGSEAKISDTEYKLTIAKLLLSKADTGYLHGDLVGLIKMDHGKECQSVSLSKVTGVDGTAKGPVFSPNPLYTVYTGEGCNLLLEPKL